MIRFFARPGRILEANIRRSWRKTQHVDECREHINGRLYPKSVSENSKALPAIKDEPLESEQAHFKAQLVWVNPGYFFHRPISEH